jgi:two-component system phosphate regulon response regulator OmpR
MAADDPAHLLVVDDDSRLRRLLSRYLGGAGFRVTCAEDAADARRRMAGVAFDLMVLDVMMPGESGLDLARDLRERSELPILLLTARGETEDRIAGLESGADDYLPKPFEPRELTLRIETILRRARGQTAPPASPVRGDATDRDADETVVFGDCRFDPDRRELLKADEAVRLTEGEAALLAIFTGSPDTVFSRAELAARLAVAQERTIDVQVTRLRRKIEDDPRNPHYLQTLRGVGYRFLPD